MAYEIKATEYGFRITQKGSFDLEEVEQYRSDVLRTLAQHDRPFSILIDSRKLVLPTPEVLEVFHQLHQAVWMMSCIRGAVIIESPVARNMLRQQYTVADIRSNDRIIDARKHPNWESMAISWIIDAVEPVEVLAQKSRSI